MNMKTMQGQYRAFCASREDLPVFHQDWWLDTVCGAEGWGASVYEEKGQIRAVMPYRISQKFGLRFLHMPRLTPFLGPWIDPVWLDVKYPIRLGREKDAMQAMIDAMPKAAYVNQRWKHDLPNWLPFFWRGFEQSSTCTYRINNVGDIAAVWDGLQSNIRREIRKAEGRFQIKLREGNDMAGFIDLHEKTFLRQGISMPYSRAFMEKLDKALAQRNARRIFIAEDDQGRAHAAVYLMWDSNCAYYLMGGGDPDLRTSGATSWVMWEAIQCAATIVPNFDFEGSMMEHVERFFRGFGAVQTPCNLVTRAHPAVSTVMHVRKVVKMSLRSLKGALKARAGRQSDTASDGHGDADGD